MVKAPGLLFFQELFGFHELYPRPSPRPPRLEGKLFHLLLLVLLLLLLLGLPWGLPLPSLFKAWAAFAVATPSFEKRTFSLTTESGMDLPFLWSLILFTRSAKK